jgi:hypothetical protein
MSTGPMAAWGGGAASNPVPVSRPSGGGPSLPPRIARGAKGEREGWLPAAKRGQQPPGGGQPQEEDGRGGRPGSAFRNPDGEVSARRGPESLVAGLFVVAISCGITARGQLVAFGLVSFRGQVWQ